MNWLILAVFIAWAIMNELRFGYLFRVLRDEQREVSILFQAAGLPPAKRKHKL